VPLITTRAVILQAFPYSDTSKILRILSPELGIRSLMAKGAMRPKSRFGGILELFTEGHAQFVLKDGRDLHTLTGFDLVRSRQALGHNLAAFAGASLIAEIVLRFGTEESHPDLFEAILAALDRTGEAGEDAACAALAGVWHVVALLGYEPELASCVGCGRQVADDESTRFDVASGGIACTLCKREGRMVEPRARRALQEMVLGRAVRSCGEDASLHRALLRAFLSSHLGLDKPLRALELFTEELR
jgi:DNA repair protein RecO (recombination protein O)